MQIKLLQENLALALNQVQKTIPAKPQLPILSSILLEASKTKINLSATDLYVGMKARVVAQVEKPTKIAIPGKIFSSVITSLPPGKIKLSLKKNTLTISAEKNKTTIQCLSAEEFPEFPVIKEKGYEFKLESVSRIKDMVGFSASIDQTRPILTALLLEFSQAGLLVVGTDGFRLTTLELSEEKMSEETQYLIPAKAMSEVVSVAQAQGRDEVVFQASQELKQAVFKIGSTQLFVRLIEGEYPPFKKIIPASFETELELDGDELENQLKRAQVFARESANIIRFQIKDKQLKIIATSPVYGRQEGVMEIDMIKGGEGEIAFNSRYLLDFMSALKPAKVRFSMNESLTPAMLKPVKEKDYRYIIMPFRVNE